MNLQCIKINDMTQLDWYIPFEVICRKVPVYKKIKNKKKLVLL